MQRVRTIDWIERHLLQLGCSAEQVERHLAPLRPRSLKKVTVIDLKNCRPLRPVLRRVWSLPAIGGPEPEQNPQKRSAERLGRVKIGPREPQTP